MTTTTKSVGPESPIGQALEKQCAIDLRGYFRALKVRVLNVKLERIVNAGLTKGQRAHAIDTALHNPLRILSADLQHILRVNIADAMMKSAAMQVQEAASSTDFLGLTGYEAADYASAYAAQQVTGINDTTRQLIADAIEQAIEQLLGVQGASRMIRQTMIDMTKTRADTIARTEISAAMSEAALRKIRNLDITYKKVILSVDACPICEDNAAADPLPLEQAYDSGDQRPPFHPNCRCTLVGARAPE